MGATEALRDWQSGWGLLGGIAAMCCMGATEAIGIKKLAGGQTDSFQYFFSGWNSRIRIFFLEGLTSF